MAAAAKGQPVVVKRYAQSRLYDVTNQNYVTVEQLRGWAANGIAFSVIDNETGKDVTSVLLF
jgi:polyhydroxyalkanoate synthesis regulator protein